MPSLRPLELSDAPAVFAGVDASRDALRRWMVWYSDSYNLADAETWIQHTLAVRTQGTGFHFAICSQDNSLIGVIGLEEVTVSGRAMLGYWVATPATGQGFGTRAVSDALAWAQSQQQIDVVWALVAEANTASRRVLEANGFRVTGTREWVERGDVPFIYEIELRSLAA
jgi:ribosomal-protein-serine acetyltransferase